MYKYFLAVSLVFVLLISGCASSPNLASTYTDPNGLFSAGIAKGWVEDKEEASKAASSSGLGEQGSGLSVLALKKGGVSIGFIAITLPPQAIGKITADTLVASMQTTGVIPAGKTFQSRTIGGIEGKEITLDGNINQQLSRKANIAKLKMILAVKDNKLVTVGYGSETTAEDFDKNLADADAMINSFKLLK